MRWRVSAVAGVAPFADIRTVLALATTGHYARDGRMEPYRADPFLSYVVARSLISALPPCKDRDVLLSEMDAVARDDPSPLAALRARPTDDLGPEAKSVVALLANRDPERFAALYRELPPGIRADMEKLSPLDRTGRLEAPVEFVSGPQDRYFPVSESDELQRLAPERVVTVTEVLDHSEVRVSLETLPEFAKLNNFAIRTMENMRGDP
jgi:pimeloyl-ACP methyl ester carboxylesterase